MSERARALLADAWLADTRDAKEADHIRSGPLNHTQRIAIAALEQALTQQRMCPACASDTESYCCACGWASVEATPQPGAEALRDGIRMDWLVSKAVEVRDPLRHGSRAMFHAQTVSDEDEPHRTKLREQVDAAMADELESLLARGG